MPSTSLENNSASTKFNTTAQNVSTLFGEVTERLRQFDDFTSSLTPISTDYLYNRPDFVKETLATGTRPVAPEISFPDIEIPTVDITVPNFSYYESAYTSVLRDAIRTSIMDGIAFGGTGLGPDVEDALYTRNELRDAQALQISLDAVGEEWSETLFYKESGDWISLGSHQESTDLAEDMYVYVCASGGSSEQALTGYYDNFTLGAPEETASISVTTSATLPYTPLELYDTLIGCYLSATIPEITAECIYSTIDSNLSGIVPSVLALVEKFAQQGVILSGITPSLFCNTGIGIIARPTLSSIYPDISATTGTVAIVTLPISSLVPSLTTLTDVFVSISLPVSSIIPRIITLGTFYAFSTNPSLHSVTEYSNFGFDSFFEDGGNYYAVNSNGIYILSGANDNGTAISAHFKGGNSDFGQDGEMTIVDAFILSKTKNVIIFKLYANDSATGQTYSVTGDGTLKNNRVRCSLGVKGYNWQWEISNYVGSNLELRRLELVVRNLRRK